MKREEGLENQQEIGDGQWKNQQKPGYYLIVRFGTFF